MRYVLTAFLCLLFSAPLSAETLKVATWNIEHLRAAPGEGSNPRTAEDYERLSRYADALNADIVALQEVEGEAAAARVFDPDEYDFFFSGRNHPQRTGFAVRKGLTVSQNADYDDLNVTGGLRHGTDITLSVDSLELRFLSVHLKSGCFADALETDRDACRKLSDQVPVLERWINRAGESGPFIIMGDLNRRFDRPGDGFWLEIDDAHPAEANLMRITFARLSKCWDGEIPSISTTSC